MHIIRILIGAVVVVLGLLVAALVMVLGLVAYFIQRLFGKPGRRPVFHYQTSFNRGQGRPAHPPRRAAAVDAIDVETIDVEVIEPKP